MQIFEMSQKKRERCLSEVTLLAQLSHPYIIQMLDAFIDENMLIIIFEWAPAGAWLQQFHGVVCIHLPVRCTTEHCDACVQSMLTTLTACAVGMQASFTAGA